MSKKNLTKFLLIAKFFYNITKNLNIYYQFLKQNYNYYLFNFYVKLKITNKIIKKITNI